MISIIIPTYNRGSTIRRTVDSVINQDCNNIELIIVDDGSTDNTNHIIKSEYPQAIYDKLGKNYGANYARNRGLKIAQGNYIMFLDSDDVLHEDAVQILTKKLNDTSNKCAGVCPSFLIKNEFGKIRKKTVPDLIHINDLADSNVIGGFSANLFKSEVFDNVGYLDESLHKYQDYDFYLRVLNKYYLAGIGMPLYTYFRHDNRTTNNPSNIITGVDILIKKHNNLLSNSRKGKLRNTQGLAYGELGQMKMARRCFKKSIYYQPFHFKYYYRFLISNFNKNLFLALYRLRN